MPRSIWSSLSYANVVSTIALVAALGTGSAYAANTVFSTDIVDGEVKNADIGGNQVTTTKIKAGNVANSDLAADAVTGAKVLAVPANTGSDEDRAEVVRATIEEFGRLDVLINNTGINPTFGPLADADLAAVRKIFDVNVVGALGFVQLALKAWMAEHGGSIVNIASVAGLRS